MTVRQLTNRQARRSLLILSGPSGVGKSTIEADLVAYFDMGRLVSHTSREPRDGELDGQHYHFVTLSHYDWMKAAGELFESAMIYGEGYGLSHAEAYRATQGGTRPAVVALNTDGCRQLKNLWPDIWSVWIDAPGDTNLANRLIARGDDPEKINERLRKVEQERHDAYLTGYTFQVDNPDGGLNACQETVRSIVRLMKLRK